MINVQAAMEAQPVVAGRGEPILSVRDLHVEYHTSAGRVLAVAGAGFDLHASERIARITRSSAGTLARLLVMRVSETQVKASYASCLNFPSSAVCSPVSERKKAGGRSR